MKKVHSLVVLLSASIAASASAHTTALPHAHHQGEGLPFWGLVALGAGVAFALFSLARISKKRRQKVENR